MRGYTILFLVGFFVAFSRGASDPNVFGSGSGMDKSTMIITPTTNKPSMDSTDDFGSGVDDEDGDVGSGSATTSTIPESTTEQTTEATTTKEATTSTKEATTQTTTRKATTTRESTTTAYIPSTESRADDEDLSGFSGSGVVKVITPEDEGTTASTSTDIYIHETTTDDEIVVIARNGAVTTKSSTATKKASTKAPIVFKSTAKASTTEKLATTTPSKAPRTTKDTTTAEIKKKVAPETTTFVPDPTTKTRTTDDPKTTQKEPRTKTESNTIGVKTGTSSEQYKTSPTIKDETTEEPREEPRENPDTMAQKGEKEGFTLTTEVIAGVVGCAVLALLLIAFLMYRLKKRDEGSYLLDESNCYPDEYKKAYASDKEAFI